MKRKWSESCSKSEAVLSVRFPVLVILSLHTGDVTIRQGLYLLGERLEL